MFGGSLSIIDGCVAEWLWWLAIQGEVSGQLARLSGLLCCVASYAGLLAFQFGWLC
jgi:hypothetical protein